MSAESKPSAHKSAARTFRLGDKSDAHIAEIVELLTAREEKTVTDTEAIRRAIAEYAQKLRKNNPKKSPTSIATGNASV